MHEHSPRLALAAVLALAGCVKNDPGVIRALQPDIAVTTLSGVENTVIFGEVVALYESSIPFTIVNAGRADLNVKDIRIKDNADGIFSVAWDPAADDDGNDDVMALEPDESAVVYVTFMPATYLDYARTLEIESNDPDSPVVKVSLQGVGVDGDIPDIQVSQSAVDFGDVEPGDDDIAWFTIKNVGDGDLDISSIAQTGSGAFVAQTPLSAQTIPPEGEVQVIFEYAPTVATGDSGKLVITSNDPDEEEVEVLLVGNGGSDDEYPVAVIDCDAVVRPLTTYDLDGRGSYDPNGGTLTSYAWTLLEAPQGSTSELINENTDYATLFIDTAGDWEVGLSVTNDVGLSSAPTRCAFEAIPEDKIHVELSWNTGDTDLDLHLVQAGFDFFDNRGDCCWCNKNPDWGTSSTADDPLLALDNIVGYGPEDLTVDAPGDGDYEVKVHYFKDLQGSGAVTTATVKVWLNGALAGTYSQNLTHNQVWDVGYIRWPQATFAPVSVEPYAAPRRSCTND